MINIDNNIIYEIIKSILSLGVKSPNVKDFISYCNKIAIGVLMQNKYKYFLIEKSGLDIDDLALDCISDLFELKDGKFIYIDRYFEKIYQIDKIDNDQVLSKLKILIYSHINQSISRLREEFGDIYFKIRKSINMYLSRNKDKYFLYIDNKTSDIKYRKLTSSEDNLTEIPQDILLGFLIDHHADVMVTTMLIQLIFDKLEIQTEYSKAISFNTLTNVVSNFFKAKYDDFIYN